MKQKVTLGSLLLLLLILAACGGEVIEDAAPITSLSESARPAESDLVEAEVASSAVDEEVISETAVSPTEAVTPTEAPKPTIDDTFETDAKGVRVGFTADGHPYRGDPDALIVIEEYSDFQCPFCARFSAQTLPGIEEQYIQTGEVLFIYYDFPLNSIHPQAAMAANAARCAGDQSAAAYWAMHDLLFANIQTWSGNNAPIVFERYAQDLGLNMEQFVDCQQTDKYADDIQADLDLGISRGVRSTPSFFVNNHPLVGAQPFSSFEQAIATIQEGGELVAAVPPTPAPWVPPTPAFIVPDDFAATLGDENAAVTIVEYTDYQCPFCGRHSAQTLPQMVSELVDSGRVHYVLKDFPLDQIHPEARRASTAARCAGENGLYWEMHDLLFENQGEWSGQGAAADPIFINLAVSLGIGGDAFNECLTDGRYDEVIEANFQEGARLGVRGTPAFFINGFPVNGAQPFDLFAYAVELAETGELAEAYRPSEEQQQQQQQQQQQAQQPPSGPVEVPLGDAFIIGDPDAPIEIVEYTDFQCPFCRRHFIQTFPQIRTNYIDKGLVRYVFKDFPLTSIHPQAVLAAEAARCANDQGAYLLMHNMLFGQQEGWSGRADAADLFVGYANQLGLDVETFQSCLTTHEHEAAVNAEIDEAINFGMRGTPGFFINGNFVNGAQPYSVFEEVLERMLAEG